MEWLRSSQVAAHAACFSEVRRQNAESPSWISLMPIWAEPSAPSVKVHAPLTPWSSGMPAGRMTTGVVPPGTMRMATARASMAGRGPMRDSGLVASR